MTGTEVARARQALAVEERTVGGQTLSAARLIDALGEALEGAGMEGTQEAQALAKRSLAIKESILGHDDPDVARSLDLLAATRAQTAPLEALALLQRSLSIRELTLGPDNIEISTSCHRLGKLYLLFNDASSARPFVERALRLRESLLGALDASTLQSLRLLGALQVEEGDVLGCRESLESALSRTETALGDDCPEVGETLGLLASCRFWGGDHAEAVSLIERSVAVKERTLGPEHPSVAGSLQEQSNFRRYACRYDTARAPIERALAILERAYGTNAASLVDLLVDYSYLLSNLHDDAAATVSKRALDLATRTFGPEQPVTAKARANRAIALWHWEQLPEAKDMLSHALATLDNQPPRAPRVLLHTLNRVALIYRSMQDDDAEGYAERSLEMRERLFGHSSPFLSSALVNLAVVTRDPVRAEALHDRAIAILRERPNDCELAVHLTAKANRRLAQRDFASAGPLLEEAKSIDERLGAEDHLAIVLARRCELGLMTKDLPRARKDCEDALSIHERIYGPDSLKVSTRLKALAAVLLAQNARHDARRLSVRSAGIIRRHVRSTAQFVSEREALEFSSILDSRLDIALTAIQRDGRTIDPGAVAPIWDEVVRSRALILDEMAARTRYARTNDQPESDSMMQKLQALKTRRAHLLLSELGSRKTGGAAKERERITREIERSERLVGTTKAAQRHRLEDRRAGLDDVARQLPPGSALIAYFMFGMVSDGTAESTPSYAAFVLQSGDGRPSLKFLGPAKTIDDRIARWRLEFSKGPPEDSGQAAAWEQRTRDVGESLRAALWDPVEDLVGSAKLVLIVPDGAIHYVSMPALPARGGGYLLERTLTFHMVSSERDLVWTGRSSSPGRGLLAVGAPDYDSTRPDDDSTPSQPLQSRSSTVAGNTTAGLRSAALLSRSFEPLPRSLAEVQEIATIWNRSSGEHAEDRAVLVTGEAADEATVKRLSPGSRVIHIATHGFTLGETADRNALANPLPSNPLLLSGLALSGANHRTLSSGSDEDNILTAEEVAWLDLENVQWVTLSACDTGVGPLVRGEGVFGLKRAFQVAGAHTLILSLWKVQDEAALQWMSRLYRARSAGATTAESVRSASMEVLMARRRLALSTHPFYWGGFIASGEWR